MDKGKWQIPNSVLGLTSMILTDLDEMMSLSSCCSSAPLLFLNEAGPQRAHVGRYSGIGCTRTQTQAFPIWPVPSAELHVVDTLDCTHLLALRTACGATSTPLSKLDTSERRRSQRGVYQHRRRPIFTSFVNPAERG
jgi:hypothetical protein